MAERAAHLVDDLFPEVPIRQWVLSLPHRLCVRAGWDHALCRAVSAVFVRSVLGKWSEVYLKHNGVWKMIAVSGRPDDAGFVPD
jgi:hypothetical protein